MSIKTAIDFYDESIFSYLSEPFALNNHNVLYPHRLTTLYGLLASTISKSIKSDAKEEVVLFNAIEAYKNISGKFPVELLMYGYAYRNSFTDELVELFLDNDARDALLIVKAYKSTNQLIEISHNLQLRLRDCLIDNITSESCSSKIKPTRELLFWWMQEIKV